MKEVLLFQINELLFGIDLPRVRSIHRVGSIFGSQDLKADGDVHMIEGEVMPLYDMSILFSKRMSQIEIQNRKLMLVDTRDACLAMMVDKIGRVVTVDEDKIIPLPPVFKAASLKCFPQLMVSDEDIIPIVSPEGIDWVRQKMNIREFMPSEPVAETEGVKPYARQTGTERIMPTEAADVRIPMKTDDDSNLQQLIEIIHGKKQEEQIHEPDVQLTRNLLEDSAATVLESVIRRILTECVEKKIKQAKLEWIK